MKLNWRLQTKRWKLSPGRSPRERLCRKRRLELLLQCNRKAPSGPPMKSLRHNLAPTEVLCRASFPAEGIAFNYAESIDRSPTGV